MRDLWALLRPYFTPTRVATLLTALLTPIAAIVIGWLAVQLAKVGIDLNQTQALGVFALGVAAVVGSVVPTVRKWIDNRTQFEKAMIENNQAGLLALAGGKSLSHVVKGNPPQFPVDDDYRLSANPADIHPDDALPDEDA